MKNEWTLLVVEDEARIRHVLKTLLKANGFQVLTAATGVEGLSLCSAHCPDLMLLDLGLPDMSGLEIISQVRAFSSMPILVVSAHDREAEKVRALDMGADDYVTKPFGAPELLARIRTALRRRTMAPSSGGAQGDQYTVGGFLIDFEKRRVTVDGELIHLTQIEYRIVELIATRRGQVLTYSQILREIWGPYMAENNRILRVHMVAIRRKIEKDQAAPQYLLTEIGVGYRMAE